MMSDPTNPERCLDGRYPVRPSLDWMAWVIHEFAELNPIAGRYVTTDNCVRGDLKFGFKMLIIAAMAHGYTKRDIEIFFRRRSASTRHVRMPYHSINLGEFQKDLKEKELWALSILIEGTAYQKRFE